VGISNYVSDKNALNDKLKSRRDEKKYWLRSHGNGRWRGPF